jgi:hypothetical protein
MTDFQKAFARAGHAHAGVLVTLAHVCQILADCEDIDGGLATVGRNGIPLAAILMPAGSSSLRCTEGRLSRTVSSACSTPGRCRSGPGRSRSVSDF